MAYSDQQQRYGWGPGEVIHHSLDNYGNSPFLTNALKSSIQIPGDHLPYAQSLDLERTMISSSSVTSNTSIAMAPCIQPDMGMIPMPHPQTSCVIMPPGMLQQSLRGEASAEDIAPLKKRRINAELLCPSEKQKLLMKREKNKRAAEKCRVKRKEESGKVRQEYDEYIEANDSLQAEVRKLAQEKEKLETILKEHTCIGARV